MKVSFAGVERQELREAADVCVRAYENYEYVTNFFPDKEESKRVLSSMIYHMGRAFFKKSHLFIAKVDDKIVGVAMFDNPEYKKPSTLQFILHGWLNVYRVADKKRLREYLAMDEAASKPCLDYQQSGPGIWYCTSLAVDPPYQGKGIGGQLMSLVGDYVRSRGGRQLVLFANTEESCRFFQKHGYEVFHECEIVHDGKKVGSWSMKKAL